MKKYRKGVFETNSSSTHSLTMRGKEHIDYVTPGDVLKIKFMDTDDYFILTTLQEKVSYLVSHIISWYKYEETDYDDLIDRVESNWDFQELEKYVKETFGKRIVFPKEYNGEIEDIVGINHQLASYSKDLRDVMEDMIINEERNLFAEVLANGNDIEFGRD